MFTDISELMLFSVRFATQIAYQNCLEIVLILRAPPPAAGPPCIPGTYALIPLPYIVRSVLYAVCCMRSYVVYALSQCAARLPRHSAHYPVS